MARTCWVSLLLCWSIWAPVVPPPAPPPAPAQLTLQIVPTSYSSSSSPEATISFPPHFHVLLTNISAAPVALFEEWNSWGYYGLSFVLTYPNGRTVRVEKKPRGWDKNFPSTVIIAPGGFYIFDVDFDPEIWEHSPRLRKPTTNGLRCRLRAVYTIAPRIESRIDSMMLLGTGPLWMGTLTSAERPVTLWP